MQYYYSPEVRLLLLSESDDKEKLLYDDNAKKFTVPKIGPRPPYYYNPRYEPYYPII